MSPHCCARSHFSSATNECIELPGNIGPRCDNVSRFDVDKLLSEVYLEPVLKAPRDGGNTVPFTATPFTARALRSYLNTWLTRTHWPNVRWQGGATKMPTSYRGCFGCGAHSPCCRGRGACVHGLCACQKGASGIDCAHSEPPAAPAVDSASGGTKRRRKAGVAIYVYDLPVDLGLTAFAFNAYRNGGGETIYLAEWHFVEALLGDNAHRTTDPELADLFYVPTFSAQGVSSNFFSPKGQMELIASHLQRYSNYWRRSKGRDHIFFLTGDKGACGLPPSVAAHPIFITHFGLLGPYAAMPKAMAEKRNLRSFGAVMADMQKGMWCHQPHKDIIAPPLVPRGHDSSSISIPPDPLRPWKHLLVHAGGIYGPAGVRQSRQGWQGSRYSQGMRQQLYELYGPIGRFAPTRLQHRGGGAGGRGSSTSSSTPPGILISEGRLPESTFADSKLCLAPTGEGWGIRMSKSVVSGCVPLIAQPLMEQPFETLLEYERFSRRIVDHNDEEIRKLPQTLSDESLTPSTLHTMRRALPPAARALEWRPGHNGLAYNLTILALCHRAIELRGRLKASPSASCNHLAKALLPLVGVSEAGVRLRASRGAPPPWYSQALANATERHKQRRLLSEREDEAVWTSSKAARPKSERRRSRRR